MEKSENTPVRASAPAPPSSPFGTPKELENTQKFDEILDGAVRSGSEGPDLSNIHADIPKAIDNKIEQAMELVKTHLTHAVLEEVDMLKSTIQELEYRMRHCHHECNYLRQHVDQKTAEDAAAYVRQQMSQEPVPTNRSHGGFETSYMTSLQSQIEKIKHVNHPTARGNPPK